MIWPTLKMRWENLQERERRAVIWGGMLVGIVFFYGVLWSPLSDAVFDRKEQLQSQINLLHFLRQASKRVDELKSSGIQINAVSQENVLSVVEQTVSQQKLSVFLKQVSQPQDNQVMLTFEKVPLDKLMGWVQLVSLTQGIRVLSLSALRTPEAGTADVKMVLLTE